MARSATQAGYVVDIVAVDDLDPVLWQQGDIPPAIVVFWRVRHRPMVERAIAAWRKAGAKILFDVDDLMVDPAIARVDVIDAIRSMRLNMADVAGLYEAIRRTMLLADACLAPTAPLAAALAAEGRPSMVVENGFDEETYRVSREAVLRCRQAPRDGLVRIGYAAGSRTHQRDFTAAAPAIAAVLREHPRARLVLFRESGRRGDLVDVAEFSEMAGLADRIEWRQAVPLSRLPEELARFDVNIAPLEVGNAFCEAKSELKYFEAALVGVPTVASPTEPFRTAIRDGETGFLAADHAAWREMVGRLVGDPVLRNRVGQAALHDVLHRHGPDGRREKLAAAFGRVLGAGESSQVASRPPPAAGNRAASLPVVPENDLILRTGGGRVADVAVVVPLFNYSGVVKEALDSVAAQSLECLELVVVDDCSTDGSLAVAIDWLGRHWRRFVRATILRNRGNRGLPLTRNTGFTWAESPLIFPLDADNRLAPECLELLRGRLDGASAAAVHPTLQRFGGCTYRHVAQPWSPDRLRHGNYIDAMALIRKSAWSHVGGYTKGDFVGWEDYELWCKFVEHGLWSEPVPEAVACYRVHGESMLSTRTNAAGRRADVVQAIHAAHPWLRVRAA